MSVSLNHKQRVLAHLIDQAEAAARRDEAIEHYARLLADEFPEGATRDALREIFAGAPR
jgi:hypothetical protein